MADIEVLGLVKRYGDLTAVDNASFSVEHGEIFGLLGPTTAPAAAPRASSRRQKPRRSRLPNSSHWGRASDWRLQSGSAGTVTGRPGRTGRARRRRRENSLHPNRVV